MNFGFKNRHLELICRGLTKCICVFFKHLTKNCNYCLHIHTANDTAIGIINQASHFCMMWRATFFPTSCISNIMRRKEWKNSASFCVTSKWDYIIWSEQWTVEELQPLVYTCWYERCSLHIYVAHKVLLQSV